MVQDVPPYSTTRQEVFCFTGVAQEQPLESNGVVGTELAQELGRAMGLVEDFHLAPIQTPSRIMTSPTESED